MELEIVMAMKKADAERHIIVCFPYEEFRFKILHIYTHICVYVHACEQVIGV